MLPDILRDLAIREPAQFSVRQQRQQLPARFHALLERAAALLADQRSLELIGEIEISEVKRRQPVAPDDARQNAHAYGFGVRGVKLVRKRRMIGMRIFLADAL